VLDIVIIGVGVGPVSAIANEPGLRRIPGTNWFVTSSPPSTDASEDERNEQDAASRSQGNDPNEQALLLRLEIVEHLGTCGGVVAVRNCAPDIRSLYALGGEKLWTIGIDGADGIITLRVNAVDEEVLEDFQGASRLLGEAQVSVTVLLNEGSAVTQPASDQRGVKEGSGGISLVSDDDDGVLQGAVPWTSEPFYSTSGPFVAVVARLGELTADWI